MLTSALRVSFPTQSQAAPRDGRYATRLAPIVVFSLWFTISAESELCIVLGSVHFDLRAVLESHWNCVHHLGGAWRPARCFRITRRIWRHGNRRDRSPRRMATVRIPIAAGSFFGNRSELPISSSPLASAPPRVCSARNRAPRMAALTVLPPSLISYLSRAAVLESSHFSHSSGTDLEGGFRPHAP